MNERAYLSNITPLWPIARQREVLGARQAEYVDELRPAALKRREAADLKQRAVLLAPTARRTGEVIEVAAWACLAWTWQDFADVIAAAHRRHATLRALDTGAEIPPDATPDVVAGAIQAFAKASKGRGVAMTRDEVAAQRKAETLVRIDRIRALWPLPSSQHSTKALLALAGYKKRPMAMATAREHLGRRPEVQRAYQNELNREAGQAAARERRKGERGDE